MDGGDGAMVGRGRGGIVVEFLGRAGVWDERAKTSGAGTARRCQEGEGNGGSAGLGGVKVGAEIRVLRQTTV